MPRRSLNRVLKICAVALPVLGGIAFAAQGKYEVKVPDGLSFSEFRGYEKWQFIAASQNSDVIDVILGNPAMIDAYATGIPAGGKHFPDGAKMAKIHWKTTKNAEGFPVVVPDTLHDIDFMVKDSKRFADTGGWGYAQFNYDTPSKSFSPNGKGANCGYSCHTAAAAKDFVFTGFPPR